MRKAVFTIVLTLIIIPIVLLTTSCNKDDGSPVGLTHPYAGSWTFTADTLSANLQTGTLYVSVDAGYYAFIPLQYDTTASHVIIRKISGTITNAGVLSGVIKDTASNAPVNPIGSINGSTFGTSGDTLTGTYTNRLDSTTTLTRTWKAIRD